MWEGSTLTLLYNESVHPLPFVVNTELGLSNVWNVNFGAILQTSI